MENRVQKNVKTSSPFLVLLDSECAFCSRLGQWLSNRTNQPKFNISDARNWPSDCPWPLEISRDCVVYFSGQQHWHMGEAAVLALAWDLGGGWRFLALILRVIPRPIRSLFYRIWSKNRYRIWGEVDSCSLPTAPQKGNQER